MSVAKSADGCHPSQHIISRSEVCVKEDACWFHRKALLYSYSVGFVKRKANISGQFDKLVSQQSAPNHQIDARRIISFPETETSIRAKQASQERLDDFWIVCTGYLVWYLNEVGFLSFINTILSEKSNYLPLPAAYFKKCFLLFWHRALLRERYELGVLFAEPCFRLEGWIVYPKLRMKCNHHLHEALEALQLLYQELLLADDK